MTTIRGKITVTILLVSLLSLGAVSYVVLTNILSLKTDVTTMSDNLGHTASTQSQEAITEELYHQLTTIAQSNATLLDERLNQRETYVTMSADYIANLYENTDNLSSVLIHAPDATLAGQISSQLILSSDAAEDPSLVSEEAGLLGNATQFLETILTHDSDIDAIHYSTQSGINLYVDTTPESKSETINGTSLSWYKTAISSTELVWTDVFNDSQGRGLAISCTAPIYQEDTLMGAISYDMTTDSIGGDIIDTTIGESGYIFVINESGRIIISSHLTVDVTGSVIRENILNGDDPEFQEMGEQIAKGESGIISVTYQGQEVLMAYQPIETQPWVVVVIMDLDEALVDSVAIGNSIDLTTGETVAQLTQATNKVIAAITVVALLSILIIVKVSMVLSKRITRPLGQLIQGVEEISAGNLDVFIMASSKDEIFRLSTAFNAMTDNLQRQIAELTAVTSEKERIGAELEVATTIQASMLPCIFPAFPEHKEFDIFATMEPAKEVGGDFYDFFLVDETHLGLVMADVSGKGVPAALFMVIAKTLIKNHAQNGESPSVVLTSVNDQLCETNDAGMFVTCWMGILNLETGVLTYGNAGHNPPLLCRKNGEFEYVRIQPGLVLAGMEGMPYRQFELTLNRGDTLYLYTDGVTEATNLHNELYEETRLQQALNRHLTDSLEDILHAVKADIDLFVGEAPQFDDITMLGITFGDSE